MPDSPLSSRLAAELERLAAALSAAAQRVREGGDAEAIHDLRVATRRLGEALATWRALLAAEPADETRRRLRRLRRRLGPVRDDEVHREDLVARLAEADLPVRLALEPVVRRLERRVERGRAEAARRVSAERIDAIRSRITAATQPLEAHPTGRPDPVPPAVARAARRRDAARRAVALAAGHDAGDALLHAARIAIKQDRYASEALAAVDPPSAPALTDPRRLEALRRVQASLGTVHDRAELLASLGRTARRWRADGRTEGAQALAPLLERIAAERRTAVLKARRAIATLEATPAPAPGSPAPGAPAAGPAGVSAAGPPRPPGVRLPGRPRGS
jgi:CHAD domain-containing protein